MEETTTVKTEIQTPPATETPLATQIVVPVIASSKNGTAPSVNQHRRKPRKNEHKPQPHVTLPPEKEEVPLYHCTNKGCSTKPAPAGYMSHLQKFEEPSVDADGNVRHVICWVCARQAREFYAETIRQENELRVAGAARDYVVVGDYVSVFPLEETLRILAHNAQERANQEAAEAQRKRETNAFFSLQVSNDGMVAMAPAEDSQEFARQRRRDEKMRKNGQRQEWDAARDRAAGSYSVHEG